MRQVIFFGGAAVASGLAGFFYVLKRKHDKKVNMERAGQRGKLSSCQSSPPSKFTFVNTHSQFTIYDAFIITGESRLLQRHTPDDTSLVLFRGVSSGIPSQHLTQTQTENQNGRHIPRTLHPREQERKASSKNSFLYEAPVPQREGRPGLVYTKALAWGEHGRAAIPVVPLGKLKRGDGERVGEVDVGAGVVVDGAEVLEEDVGG
ncbi:hypothetical protein BD410DRAFT_785023, partial [Rickenella mellea]